MDHHTPHIAFFPLQVFILPGEELQLTIFEPRYKQLINDCLEKGTTFGIPYSKDDVIGPYGSEVSIKEVLKKYANGEMDILVEGINVIKLTTFLPMLHNKLYAGGAFETVEINETSFSHERARLYTEWLSFQEDITVEMEKAQTWVEMAIEMEMEAEQKLHLVELPQERRERYQEGLMLVLVSLLQQEKALGDRVVLN